MDATTEAMEKKALAEIQDGLKEAVKICKAQPDFGSNPRDQENFDFLQELLADPTFCGKVFRTVRAVDQLMTRLEMLKMIELSMMTMNEPVGPAN